ncbi:hypothetical protein L227DRAFT_7816 [Lentinus tigrinus ALCF2SS1-6]|uniref:Uncharacterized protein n=1 Tax=Lentinus tigrinus ALCF2SS1-6 TaxID=1328759 RepID=A0A5C2SV08_9APHY|nr:hypothetical protein L227DRAFT_7816 [Lentinus tigrinus ALCF2SS1-6]
MFSVTWEFVRCCHDSAVDLDVSTLFFHCMCWYRIFWLYSLIELTTSRTCGSNHESERNNPDLVPLPRNLVWAQAARSQYTPSVKLHNHPQNHSSPSLVGQIGRMTLRSVSSYNRPPLIRRQCHVCGAGCPANFSAEAHWEPANFNVPRTVPQTLTASQSPWRSMQISSHCRKSAVSMWKIHGGQYLRLTRLSRSVSSNCRGASRLQQNLRARFFCSLSASSPA